ncbi:signal peptidase II [uncultured Hydrogenophaga sp.]|jgi:signal peptidase II|uniref:signal peptidase II n=1 Tax=uncultured Hydrogenophaga sp. TaxID=199683 RepID=UPI002583F47C|nr:signal peptidase II [uncultured Hydrogenophaga sp.]
MARASLRDIAPWLGLAALAFALDQITKWLILASFALGDSVTVTSFFNVVRVHNEGAAFSFLAGASGWQRWFFTAIGIAASVFIVWMLRSHPGQKLFAFALACILGGAIGNVLDRLVHGYVVDWLDFHWSFLAGLFPGGHFPSFNLADTFISIGAACLILDEILRVRKSRAAKAL